ncbi:SMP-30/gluconolactonase/LRE family protein [Methylobacterium sp. AMS5]|uniref:SMP-30/gluconolactonase/LRE family protein n=1 Tax=Methylobacterium sp. AMS5 TaxID=925818 RepID=UPI00074FA2EC|nr:SMP-30/gluconolactonase/LRE family protein [Methylobacterium sp. AMS5]AMB43672.1 gluconolactonase [Methylobacterium sp. AMS5]
MTESPSPPRRGIARRPLLGLALLGALASRALAADDLSAVLDPSSRAETLYDEGAWCEGPVWVPSLGGLIVSDVRRNRMMLIREGGRAEVFREPSNNSNGNAVDAEGRLVTCEHRTSRVVRRETDGSITVLADRYDGGRLNAPNDVVVARDGAIWFSDPTYGIDQPEEGKPRPSEQKGRFVFRLAPDGSLAVATDRFVQPNGLAFSPDERVLYICESGTREGAAGEIRAFDVADGQLANERVFATVSKGVPDGVKVDTDGRVYAGTGDGVRIWSADGRPVGHIPTEGPCANIAFGGPDGRRLLLCAGKRVLAIETKARGAAIASQGSRP